ncbi:MAG TPA: VWA domain-containing protein [Terriglobales bacterium]|jgi:Ca-activated chloride channel homolog
MYMQELGTTLLRNKSVISRVAAGLLLLGMAAAQSTPAPQAQPSAAPANNAPSTPPTQNPQAAPPVTQGNPPQEHGAQGDPPPGPGDQGQAPVGSENGGFVFRAEAREVTLHATVVDDRNHLVNNLDKTDFTVFENDKPQKITHFHQEDFPVAIGIVIDNSGSMREKRDAVNKAALNLIRASNPDDQVFVVNFNDEYYLDQEFTGDIKKLQAALEHVEARGGTALYDAIVASADYLTHSRLQRKALFVVTDGEDDASQESLEQAVHKLQQENGPVVYAIGILGEEKSRRAKRALELVADRTGGISFFPPSLDQVDEISREIAHDIRNQYTITYAPSTPKTVAGYRTIHVDAHARPYKKLTVRTRTGYYPGQEQQGAGGIN